MQDIVPRTDFAPRPVGYPHDPDTRWFAITLSRMEVAPKQYQFTVSTCLQATFRIEGNDGKATYADILSIHHQFSAICAKWKDHGYIYVDKPDEWGRYWPEDWADKIKSEAFKRATSLFERSTEERRELMSGYNRVLGNRIMEQLNAEFSKEWSLSELKRAIDPEMSNSEILTTLDSLQRLGDIAGKTHYGSTTSARTLDLMSDICLTAQGYHKLNSEENPFGMSQTNYGGDHIEVKGNVGSIGPHSIGTINHIEQWEKLKATIDLGTLQRELEAIKHAMLARQPSNADLQQVAILAEAEDQAKKKDGTKVLQALSSLGKGVLELAKTLGVELAANVIAEAIRR